MDNAKYHSRLSEKTPTANIKKNYMISFMTKHHIEIPSPLPVKHVLLEKIREANILKKYIIDSMATTAVYSVLRLPPYHCVFNPIEMVWNKLKHYARHLNIYTSQPAKIIDLLRNVCDQKITKEHWENVLVML